MLIIEGKNNRQKHTFVLEIYDQDKMNDIARLPMPVQIIFSTSAGVPSAYAVSNNMTSSAHITKTPSATVGAESISLSPSRPIAEFLFHLTRMLSDPLNPPLIEWTDGKIRVHDPNGLENGVLGRFFRHTKYSSFQRQLNYFGFKKVGAKGKMSPCWFINSNTTNYLTSLLHIKRKPANQARKANAAKARKVSTCTLAAKHFCELSTERKSNRQKKNSINTTVPGKRMYYVSLFSDMQTQSPFSISSAPAVVLAEEFGSPGTVNFSVPNPLDQTSPLSPLSTNMSQSPSTSELAFGTPTSMPAKAKEVDDDEFDLTSEYPSPLSGDDTIFDAIFREELLSQGLQTNLLPFEDSSESAKMGVRFPGLLD